MRGRCILALVFCMTAMTVLLPGCNREKSEGELPSSASNQSDAAEQGDGAQQEENLQNSYLEPSLPDTQQDEDVTPVGSENKEVVLVGSKLSWFVPSDFIASQTADGFIAYSAEQNIGIACKKASLAVLKPGFSDLDTLQDDVLKSKLYEYVNTQEYQTSEYNTTKVRIAGQEGYAMKCTYQIGDVTGRMVILCIQFDTDLVIVSGVSPEAEQERLWKLISTITAAKSINTTWVDEE